MSKSVSESPLSAASSSLDIPCTASFVLSPQKLYILFTELHIPNRLKRGLHLLSCSGHVTLHFFSFFSHLHLLAALPAAPWWWSPGPPPACEGCAYVTLTMIANNEAVKERVASIHRAAEKAHSRTLMPSNAILACDARCLDRMGDGRALRRRLCCDGIAPATLSTNRGALLRRP